MESESPRCDLHDRSEHREPGRSRLERFAIGFEVFASIVAILCLLQEPIAKLHPVLSCVTFLFFPWEEALYGLGGSVVTQVMAGIASVATWGCVFGFIGMMWRHPGRDISRACGTACTLARWPEWSLVLGVGLALAYVNAAVPVWYPSSTLSWKPGDIEVDGRQDRRCHLGWPMTYYVNAGGGLEQRPSWMWMATSLDSHEVDAFFGPAQLAVDVVWAMLLLWATWCVATRVMEAARRRQVSLWGLFVLMTVVALVVFLEAKCRDNWREWHNYDGASPYLTWSALYQWFGPRSSYDWLNRYGLVVRLPIILAWFCLVWQACSLAFARCRKWMPVVATKGPIDRPRA